MKNYQLTETLFETALDAQLRGSSEFCAEVRKLQLEWAFKAGKYENGWHVLERSLYALATLVVVIGDSNVCDELRQDITRQLKKPDAPDREIRDRAARNIRSRAATLYRAEPRHLRIDTAMSSTDHQRLRPLLGDLANIISPETGREPVQAEFV